jgi:hypothetical protein
MMCSKAISVPLHLEFAIVKERITVSEFKDFAPTTHRPNSVG